MTSLANALRAFVQNDCDRSAMNVPAWAVTYNCEPDAIRAAWEQAMTHHSHQQHRNGEDTE